MHATRELGALLAALAAGEQAALKKGMIVRIQAPVSANGQFLEPINSLIIFSAPASGVYYLGASSPGFDTGDYVIAATHSTITDDSS